MTKIYLYGGEATYAGHCDFEWQAPRLGARHKLILFLAQDENESREDIARSELARFGFTDFDMGTGRPIDVESLNDPRMHAFRRHYEGALDEGCSLVWYP
ncbi:hypothetical protein Q5W_06790 [Hydrogenophaga sp. PBC]|jgi:hypothetical protein|nr:hypothetical protein Q5W_06790 [Hydrogenophaga sp. PBC]